MSVLNEIKSPIKNEMEQFQPFFKAYLRSNARILNLIINYLLKQKGKQIRPMLVFLSAQLNGKVTESSYNAAALIELMHTATLVHDDVVDDSNMRRGMLSIKAIWKNKIAVLLGDFLLAKGLLMAVEKEEFELLRIVSKAVEEMSEGELIQIEKARKLNIDEETYFNIVKKKTAALMVACTIAGAHSAGANEKSKELMGMFGQYMGIAFQIKDDLFDFDKKEITGKPSGNDIKERKVTLPLIHALTQCSKKEKSEIIKKLRKKNKSTALINEIREFIKRYNGIEYAKETMLEYKQKALDILLEFPQNEANKSLFKLVEYTISRKK